MAEHGGPTTQSGILYQNSIAALYLGRLLDVRHRAEHEIVSRVRVEAPEIVDDIVVTYADEHKAYIQVKESLAGSGPIWQKVWQDFKRQFGSGSFQKRRDRLCLHVGDQPEYIKQLRALCERALENQDYEEWRKRLTSGQETLLKKIELTVGIELSDSVILLDFFQHLKVEVWPLDLIERDLVPSWMPESSSPPIVLFRILRDKAGDKARIRGSFTASDLRDSLTKEAQVKFDIPPDLGRVRESFSRASSLLRITKHTIGKMEYHISQPIVGDIVDWAITSDDDQKNMAMLLDQAGYGKTVVFRDVLIELENRGIAVLGVKCDQQLPYVTSLSEIQEGLNLTHPVENCVESLAKLGRVVILIDQVDALSLTLAHNQRTLNVVLDLAARLRRIPNVRIVISCRLFDRNNDPRLRQIETNEPFRLPRLQVEEVRELLIRIGIEYDSLSKPTQELLTIPLHLALFVYAVENSANSANLLGDASTLQDLYELIWENVVLSQTPQALAAFERVKVLNCLTEYMDREQEVSAPFSLFQQPETVMLEKAVNWLASAGIIIRGKTRWTFLHQTFFDYCYARRFVEEGGDLVEVILASEQGLFERTKLIQVISYQRSTNPRRYAVVLRELLTNPALRYHLKDLTIRWLGSLPDPSENEWILARQMLNHSDTRPVFMSAMQRNIGWFQRLQETYLSSWLLDDDITDRLVIPYLLSIIEVDQSQVMVIIRDFLGKSERWNARIATIFLRVRNWESRETIELYAMHFMQWPFENRLYQLVDVAEAAPIVGCRLIGFVLNHVVDHYLEQRSHEIEEKGASYVYSDVAISLMRPLESLDHTHLDKAIKIVSDREPQSFVETLLPWLEKVVSIHGVTSDSHRRFSWDELSIDRHGTTLVTQNAIVQGMSDALVKTAKVNADFFDEVSSKLQALPYETPQFILASAYASEPELLAAAACEFLVADQRRLALGTQEYDSRQLLRAIYPHLDTAQRNRLETTILSYAPIYKSYGIEGLRLRGIEQLYLLQAIPRHYLSPAGLRRLSEWERKFPGERASEKPLTGEWGSVTSPIPQEIAEKMSDRDWLRAMGKYQGNVEHWATLKGGARELGGLLEELVSKDPKRFVHLFESAPDDVDDAYVVALINGLVSSTASIDWLFATIRRFAARRGRDVRGSITRALAKKAKSNEIPGDLIQMLIEWLNESSSDDEWWWSKGDNHSDVYQSYLNSDRGQSFNTLMRICDAQDTEDAQQEKWKLIEFAANDDSSALRLGAIYELTFLIRVDPPRATSLFDRLMKGHTKLFESAQVREFVYYGLYRNYLHFAPYISAMMQHELDSVKESGAQLACIAALSAKALESDFARTKAYDLAQSTLYGPPAWRRGAARIYSHNIAGDSLETCMQNLISLLEDDDEQVLRHINSIFLRIKEVHVRPLRKLLDAYAGTATLFDTSFSKYLFSNGLSDPEWALLTVQTYTTRARQRAQHPSQFGLEDLLRLVLQIYTHPLSSEGLRRDAMDVFDSLMKDYSAEALGILREWDAR